MTSDDPKAAARIDSDPLGDRQPTQRRARITATWARIPSVWRPVVRSAWILIVLTAVVVYELGIPYQYQELLANPAYDAALLAQSGLSPEFAAGYNVALAVLTSLLFVGTAALLFARRTDDRITLFASIMLASFGTAVVTGIPGALARSVPAAAIPVGLVEGIGNASLVAFLYTFPTGEFVPRWTRWPPLLYAIYAILIGLFPGAPFSPAQLPTFLQFAIPMTIYVSAIPLFEWRKRRVLTAAQRQQAKWIQTGLGFALAGWVGLFAIQWAAPLIAPSIPLPVVEIFTQAYLLVTLSAVPLGIVFSVLRYRLWEVDFVINRSLIYGALTALLIAVFFGLVLGLQRALDTITGGEQSPVAFAAAALAIGALFQPARRLLRRIVDRRFFGIYVNYHTADFAPRPAGALILKGAQLGMYVIEEPLGRGGMADIYKGRHVTLGRPVAIKVLPSAHAREEDFVRRFEREAQTVAALRHPNIVALYDYGQVEGTYYMVMEYIAGRDLGDIIHSSAPLSLDQATRYIRDVAGALDYAHEQGVVHRDVKPSNVMLQPDTTQSGKVGERAILTDFGIARMLTAGPRITRTGLVGTFDYMAPEQIRDQPDIDGRADVYALGCMAYEMLTGRAPFRAAHPGAVLIAHLQQPVLDPQVTRPDLPDRIGAAVLRAMEKAPANRFRTAGEFAAALG